MIGTLGSITGGSGGTAGTYGGVALTGGTGSSATANVTVGGGGNVTGVTILNPGIQYTTGDVLSAAAANIGNTLGFSVPISSTAINGSLANGSVGMFYPGTTNPKPTWQDPNQLAMNSQPIPLDANGCAVIYGTGSYRQQLFDSLGNLVWDQLTTDTSATNNVFWAGTSGGTPNIITVTDAGFNGTDGSIIEFVALSTNTTTATLNPSSFGAIPITKPTAAGPVSLVAGDITQGNVVEVVYRAGTNTFQLLSAVPSASSTATLSPTPQGYLTLSSDPANPIITADVIGATTVYYTPYVGNQVPIYNGVSFVPFIFSQLSLTLTANFLANTIYDVCVFSNQGSPTLVAGPAWSNSTAGASSRGAGANSAQLARVQGFWVNAVSMIGTNGGSSFTIAANQCSYMGSISIDSTIGQVSAFRSYGQNRKFGVWNAYNRIPITIKAGDSTAAWNYSTPGFRASDANSNNVITTFTGLAEEQLDLQFKQKLQVNVASQTNGGGTPVIGIGFNSITTNSGFAGQYTWSLQQGTAYSAVPQSTVTARYVAPPMLGINNIQALESGGNTNAVDSFFGTEFNMLLTAQYRG